ncbi:endospore germination permease [Paenibacillus sp. MBLB4367]|uniref:GerAB/ArcD/ProY family transporter n=1 Tax=Paenibacillus sp. MBLB4367 TaxID=3384767 RepID=UPI003907EF6A
MLDNGKISPRQYMIIVTLFTVGDWILYVPNWLAAEAKQDAWIGAAFCLGEGLLAALLFMALAGRFPRQAITQYGGVILGRVLGWPIALLYVIFFLFDASIILRELGDFMTTQIMPETPIESILILFTVSIVIGTRLGAETISRSSELLFPLVILLFCILILFIWPQIEIRHIRPVFEEGVKPIMSGNLRILGVLEEAVILLMLFPYVNQPRKAAKAFTFGILTGLFLLTVLTAVCILVLGHDLTAMYGYPSYALAQKISVGNFFERIEVIVAFLWFMTIYTKITVCFYAASLGVAHLFRLANYRFLTLPLAIVMYNLAIIFVPNKPYFDTFVSLFWTPYTLTYGLFFPVLFLFVAMLRKKSGQS